MRDSEQIAEMVRSIALPIVRALAVDLVDVVCSGQGGKTLIRVYLDKPGGVTIADCEEVHVSLGHALDVADPIPHTYTLEVSSPGLDRPIRKRAEYERAVGKLLRIKLVASDKSKPVVVGRLSLVDDAGVTLTVGSGKQTGPLRVPWTDIVETRFEVEF